MRAIERLIFLVFVRQITWADVEARLTSLRRSEPVHEDDISPAVPARRIEPSSAKPLDPFHTSSLDVIEADPATLPAELLEEFARSKASAAQDASVRG